MLWIFLISFDTLFQGGPRLLHNSVAGGRHHNSFQRHIDGVTFHPRKIRLKKVNAKCRHIKN
jgi:hypothetical protein